MSEPTPTTEPGAPALQAALAAEHAAVFVYGALGAQASQSATPALHAALTEAYVVHRDRRDELDAMVAAVGAEPVAAEPGYDLPADLRSPAAVTARALRLERAAATTYAHLVASTSGDARAWAVDALRDAAVRALRFGGGPEQLPGL
ncbi:DUF4439 domain-containing protein [Nocardioides sp. SYSU DS0651]|uniref:DUF4439 domain-containing protein n=1 Tax=Nocardioides sp. SYSU DS0651 TaxID=3415955 RepID=UPI003F4B2FC7